MDKPPSVIVQSLEHALVGQVSPPQHGDVAGGLRWRAGILQPGIQVGRLPGTRQADPRAPGGSAASPSARRAAGGMPSPSAKASKVVEAFGIRLRRAYSLSRPCKMPVSSAICPCIKP